MSSTWGQSAWTSLKSSSETKRSAFSNGTRFLNSTNFNNWLVGVTDGDGTFYFAKSKKGLWTFSFQISQSTYNLRLLYYIKSKLNCGTVTVLESNMAVFRVRKVQHLLDYIIPIFDICPLLTSKYFSYDLFKKSLLIVNDSSLSEKEKNYLLSNLKLQKLPIDYVSPAWLATHNSVNNVNDANRVVAKAWLVGFTEAEGSFYIVKKDPKRLVHAFEITQKHDIIVLKSISLILNMKVLKKKTYITAVTTKSNSIKYIVKYFFKAMKGMKSIEYRIWSRSFNKKKKDFIYLTKVRNKMRKIRSIRLDKSCKIKPNFKLY